MTGRTLARVGLGVAAGGVVAGLAAPPLLLLAAVGLVLWTVGVARREREWDEAATALLDDLSRPDVPEPDDDAGEQLRRIARTGGVPAAVHDGQDR